MPQSYIVICYAPKEKINAYNTKRDSDISCKKYKHQINAQDNCIINQKPAKLIAKHKIKLLHSSISK